MGKRGIELSGARCREKRREEDENGSKENVDRMHAFILLLLNYEELRNETGCLFTQLFVRLRCQYHEQKRKEPIVTVSLTSTSNIWLVRFVCVV